MFLNKKKPASIITKKELIKHRLIWLEFMALVQQTEEEFFKLWDTGVDLVPTALTTSFLKSKIDH